MSENTPEQDQQIDAADAGDKQTDDAPSAEPVDTEAVNRLLAESKSVRVKTSMKISCVLLI